uniref:Uncharacterized protein n=1 Tax=Arundo donax TaxID=35708 RepID=A0A0A9C2J9_ARUDO
MICWTALHYLILKYLQLSNYRFSYPEFSSPLHPYIPLVFPLITILHS